MFPDYAPQDFLPLIGAGGLAGAGVIAGTAAMSYYATADDGYRLQGIGPDADENLLGDLRLQVLTASLLAGPFAASQGFLWAAGAMGILGTSALFSLVSTEGQRWAESGEYFGISLPALPAMPVMGDGATEALPAPAAPAAPAEPDTAAEAVSGVFGRMY